MSSNPIQRKTRNAFLLGMTITLVIAVVIVALLYMTMFKNTVVDMKEKEKTGKIYAYKVITLIESGETIPENKIQKVEMYIDDVPTDVINDSRVFSCKSKLNLMPGTILSESLLYQEKEVNNSTRLMEYNMLTLPSTLQIGDYVDIRLTTPNGENYIVLSKKEVKNIQNKTVSFYLTEDEILMMSSAIIESYIMKASNLFVAQYVEAGMQEASIPTYVVNGDVYKLILANAQKGINIEDYAKINESYSTELRGAIEQELSEYSNEKIQNIEEGLTKQKEEAMSLYLSGLSGE